METVNIRDLPDDSFADIVLCETCERRMNINIVNPLWLQNDTYMCVPCFEHLDFKQLVNLIGMTEEDKKLISDALNMEMG